MGFLGFQGSFQRVLDSEIWVLRRDLDICQAHRGVWIGIIFVNRQKRVKHLCCPTSVFVSVHKRGNGKAPSAVRTTLRIDTDIVLSIL